MEQRNNLVLHGTETFSRGALDNVALESGAVVLDSSAGRYLPYGSYTTPEFAMPAFCNLNVSWNASAPLAGGSQGSGHACAACTHDDDVGINSRVLSRLSVVLHSGLEILRLQTSSGDGSSGCLLDGIGGDGSTGHAIYFDAAALGDLAGQLLDCLGAHALGLIGTLSGAAGDLAVGQGQGNGNIAAKALGSAGKITGSTSAGGGGGLAAAAVAQQAHCNDSSHGQRCNALFHLRIFHGFFFFLLS